MANDPTTTRYRKLYARLLRLYPRPYRERFGEEMEQTFNDLCQERKGVGKGLFTLALWTFSETFLGILRENISFMAGRLMHNKNIIRLAFVTACLLLVPFVAMQFTDEVTWSLADFVFAGGLVFGTGLAYELVAKRAGNLAYRAAVGVALAAAFILVWANLAVGLIGSEDNPANLMYVAVLAVGFVGTILARLQPRGMARVLFAIALTQALIAVIALAAGMHEQAGSSVVEIIAVNGFFITLWLISAWLFRKAAQKQPSAVLMVG